MSPARARTSQTDIVAAGRELLEAGGLDVTYLESDAAHHIDPAHVPAAVAWVGDTLPRTVGMTG